MPAARTRHWPSLSPYRSVRPRDVQPRQENQVNQIAINRTATPKPTPADDTLTFGNVFSDHIFLMNYEAGKGWHNPRIEPYGPFTLDPATCVLHYGQAIFDGLKAFRGADGRVRLFRLPDHARRLNKSAHYLCIPRIDPAMVEASIRALVEIDERWVPHKPGTSLYIRPTVIATETFLGVHPSHSYLYYVIVGPVGAYYKEGMNPVRILASDQHVRAVVGGLGAAKTMANYAASLYGAEEAQKAGYTQVLWLDGVEHKYLDEVGTMNIMLKIGDEVITPPSTAPSSTASPAAPSSPCCRTGACASPNAPSPSTTSWPPPRPARSKCGAPAPPPSSRQWENSVTRASATSSTAARPVP